MFLYLNGDYIKSEEAAISPFDHGFLYGLGLFETFRTYHGHPFLLDDHFHRLHEGAKAIGIELPEYKREDTCRIIHQLLELNNLEDGYFRWNVSAGEREIGLSHENYFSPNTIVIVKPLPQQTPREKEAVFLQTTRNTPEGTNRLKSHHFLNNLLGKRELGDQPGTEGIFLTENGEIAEGIVSNIYWVKKGTLYTPSEDSGALNGITRQFILKLAETTGLNTEEGLYGPESLLSAEEAFISNSIQEITALSSVKGRKLPGANGCSFKLISAEYKKHLTSLWSRLELTGRGID
ncbi:aminodeoxychorismate lyase [Evansella sp. LMS18]|uniref:aminodeoxychorismate lyase n=1 Tax=Evansella sp. LMS18 TaxID=2924033 RepID=UPI0020D1565F|nr:aminodeoxychorismate lyase [Evansella sp. LMS18]UTR12469.1 aminodeoxychorismate lyase [Evansella sp. LMS18]